MPDISQASVAVITATIGHPQLARALRSVQDQTHAAVEHWVIVDGPEFEASVRPALESRAGAKHARAVSVLPYRTGMDGWCSHRIYAAAPFLVNADFVCFLDQDNWFEPDHVERLLREVRHRRSPAAYSLRQVYSREGELVCADDCQSLGPLHDSFDTPGMKHIDTNCWLLAREFAMSTASQWCQPYTGDRTFARYVMECLPSLPCTRAYSVNYTAESRAQSASIQYFLDGNEAMRRRFPGGLPWRAVAGA